MGLLVVFLSLTNIALGYGLAVYFRRASAPTTSVGYVAPQPEVLPAAKPPVVVAETPAPILKEEVAPPVVAEAIVKEVAPVPPEEQPKLAELPPSTGNLEVTEVEPAAQEKDAIAAEDTKPAVDEASVLAGIEAFRAQLANVKDEVEDEAIEEPATS